MTAETALITSNRQARRGQAHPPAAIVARSEGEILPPGASWIEAEQAYNFSLYAKHAESVVLLLFAEDDLDQNYSAVRQAGTLFVGLSVAPYVYYKERPMGPHAGAVLRPSAPLPTGSTDAKPSPASSASRK